MARIRSVKPEFWVDRSLARKLSRDARLLYIGLWNFSDEHSRLGGDVLYIKGQVFPYEDDLNAQDLDKLLDEIASAGKVVRYEVDGDPYLFLPTLDRHQRLEPKVASRLPAPPDPYIPPSGPSGPASRTDKSARDADKSVRYENVVLGTESSQVSTTDADLSARHADEPAPDAEKKALLYVAGGRWQVAGNSFLSEPAPPPNDEQIDDGHDDEVDTTPPMRLDAEQLCTRLAERLIANGCKPPKITKKWRDDARLLLDNDKRDLQDALRLIDWCQSDPFWRSNIQSMPTFRKQYDQLRLKGLAQWEVARGNGNAIPGARKPSTADQRVAQAHAAAAELAAEIRALGASS